MEAMKEECPVCGREISFVYVNIYTNKRVFFSPNEETRALRTNGLLFGIKKRFKLHVCGRREDGEGKTDIKRIRARTVLRRNRSHLFADDDTSKGA